MNKTWTGLQGGSWADAKTWSPAGMPGSGDTALVTGPGSYTITVDLAATVQRLELGDPGALLLLAQAPAGPVPGLTIADGLTLDAGTLELLGQVCTAMGDGGAAYTIATPVTLDLAGGLDTSSGAPGAGTIAASLAALDFSGSQTLDDATLLMQSAVALAATGTLTFGAGFTLDQTGSLDTLDGAIVNRGRINFDGGPWARIGANQPGDLANSGTIAIDGEQVIAAARDFANSGLVQVGGILDLTVSGTFGNTGTLAIAAGGTFGLTADTTLAGLGSIDNAGGAVGFGGTLDLAAGTLDLAPTGAFANVLLSGTVRNGTIRPDGGTLTVAGGTFDAITYDGTLDLSTLGSLTTLDVADGLAVAGGTIAITGPGDVLQFLDSETLDNVTLNVGSASGTDARLLGDPAGTLTLGPAAVLNQAGGQVTVAAGTIVNQGRIAAAAGALGISGSNFSNAGTIGLSGTATCLVVQAATLSNSGSIAIGAGDTLTLQSIYYNAEPPPPGLANTGTISLAPGGELVLDLHTTLAALGTVAGSGGTLEIAAKQAWFASQTGGVLDLGGGTLEIGGGGAFSDLIVAGTVENGTVRVDGGGTVELLGAGALHNVNEAPCFLAGTRLRTPDGEKAVEALAVGEHAITATGATRPIVWIGRRRIDCRRHPHPELVWPVRIRAGAFAPDQPRRDLFLSPDHAVRIATAAAGPVLIPAKYLANGLTIVQEPAADAHYFHVELATHDVLLAEGLPVESYLDTGNRRTFANGGGAVALHPDFSPLSWDDACLPLCLCGPEVEAARRHLLARAKTLGWRASSRTGLHVLAAGRAIAPASVKGQLHRFVLPERTRRLGIVSRSAAPAEGAAGRREWRRLGLRIGGILADGRAIALDSAALGAGFHPLERSGAAQWRWTDGAAELSLPARSGPVLLELLVLDRQPGLPDAGSRETRPEAA